MPRETRIVNGVGVSEIPRDARYAMQLLLPMVRAQKRLHEGNYDNCDSESVYHLYMTAYDDKELAENAQLQALQNLVEKSCRRGER